ncbi:MAG: hypothetical protein ACHQU1_08085 [Gemmatimonadales bacterium]
MLYFDNLSRDTTDAYLADGLTEQTIAQLGEVNRLTVSSRYAVRRFRGNAAPQDPAVIGRALNVTFLVTGSVQRAGPRLRVDVELLRANTGIRVWGDQYDRTATDILQLQDDIASAVATGIVGRLLPTERRAIATRTTRSPAAYDQFLRGNFYLAQRTEPTLLLAVRSYRAAVAADPSFTDALAREAYCYGNALDDEADIGVSRDSLVQLGMRTAQRAVTLDSLSSDAWMAVAYARQGAYPTTFEGVREAYERALRLNPRNAEAHHQFGSFLSYIGDTLAARVESERALALEPGRAVTWFGLEEVALDRHQPTEAMRLLDSARAADPTFRLADVARFMVALDLNDTAMMRRANEELQRDPSYALVGSYFAAFLAAFKKEPGSLEVFNRLANAKWTGPGSQIAAGYSAMLGARLGDTEAALAFLAAAQPRGIRLHEFLRRAPFDAIRGDPRFQAIWRETMPPGASW